MASDKTRIKIAEAMKSRLKKNSYSQNSTLRERFFGYPSEGDAGHSDCSSAVRLATRRATRISIGSNTVSQVNNNKDLSWLEFSNGKKYPTVQLLPGDLLYFKGTDKSRPYMVGHVEMVDTDTDYLLGHGSGTGPRRIKLKDYCASRYNAGKGLIGVKRLALEEEAYETTLLGNRYLKYGSRGDDVKELQEKLLLVGYDCDGIDGIFGVNTRDALKAFQYASQIEVDGIFGPESLNALKSALEAAAGDPADEETGAAAPTHVRATGNCWIRTLPSTAGAKSAVLYKGETLERSGEDTESWHGVLYNGSQRYVSKKYTEAEGDA